MKRFYNNTLIGGAFSKALRVVALLCVLLGFSSSAWGDTYYLWYNAKSNEPNYKNSNFEMSAGATLTNNKCVWTISNLRKDNSYFYISTSSTYSESNLKSVNITVNNPNDAVVNAVGKQDYSGKVGFYVSCKTAGSTVTITIDFSSNSQYVVSPVGGGAAACTPSVSMVSAIFNGTQIEMKGNVTKSCGSAYRGFEYSTDGNNWMSTGGGNSASTGEYTGNWTPTKKGTTYFIRASYGNSKSSNTISVKIPAEGSGDVNCSNIVYLDPNNIWNKDGAWFAARFWNDAGDKWVEMKATSCGNIYYAEIPDGYVKVIFVRMDPNKSLADGWNGKWNQTLDLTLDNECYKITTINTCTDGKSCGSWGTTDCTDGCTQTDVATNVLLSREAIVNKSAKTAQLFGYLKATNCERYTDYGFYYCMVNDGDTPCTPTPTSSSTKIAVDPSEELLRGTEFTATVGLKPNPSDALQDGKTYYYRAYATSDKGTILSEEIRSFATDPCIPQYGGLSDKYNGKPIVYTINADPAFVANDCKLHFKSLQAAIDHLKATNTNDDDFKYVTLDNGSYNLNQPVEMRVVYYDDTPDDNTSAYAYRGKSIGANEDFVFTGQNRPVNANLIEDINKSGAKVNNTLSIKAGTNKAKPWIHHIVIRNSKNIVLDSLAIFSDPSGIADNALEIDVNTTQWHTLKIATCADANIVIQNSMIGSAGFTGVHVSGYDGITFKNNDFEAIFDGTDGDAVTWGASAKFMASKNIKFIQNNFRGDHACLLWLQESQNFLIMNNVFWNTNKYASKENVSAIKLVAQFGDKHKNKINLENIDIYYNTFYLADEKQDAKYNFLQLFLAPTTENSAQLDQFVQDGVKFKYNNCYSYDTKTSGIGNYNPGFANFSTQFPNTCPNNFWSEYDQIEYNKLAEDKKASYVSAFAFGCADNEFINVKSQVCSTTASGPASLIVKGKGMDYGVIPDISTTGITLEPNEQYADRYIIGARPANGKKWTYGAYQSKDEITTQTIYWVGFSSDWDDRNNWEYETEVDGKMVRQRVSCANILSEDLKVVVEEIGTLEIAGGRKWPQVPASFTENRTNSQYDEHVSAGLGTGKTPTKFASTIELEYGAGLRGVENLNDNGTMRYDQAIVHFDAERNKWLLVGPIVRPFDTEKNDGTTRNVNSGDYFRNFEPQIYMHGTVVNGSTISWGKTFGDLNVNVTPDTVFAINASVLYGKYYDTAEDYLKYEGIKVDDKAPIPYRFTGRFAVEEYKTGDAYQYTLKETNDKNLINNVYPCNLDAKAIESKYGQISIYNYENASFESIDGQTSGNVYIKAQNGFVFTPNTENPDKELKLTNDILAEGSTRTRAGEIPLPTFSLNVDNANTTKPGASNIVVRYDEFLGTSEESLLNTPKVFTRNSDTPEAYIIHNDGKYTRLDAGKEKVTIPLGVRLMKPMNLTFEKVYNEGYDEVVLVDTKTQKFYNLLKRTYTTDVLSEGDTEGRFYLNLTVSGDDDLDDEGDNPGGDDIVDDDDVSTEVEETIEEPQINIYAVDNSIVRVSSVGTVLKTIYVSDMTGRTDEYSVDGNYVELQLPVSSGVYTVTAVGETASKIGKVILK